MDVHVMDIDNIVYESLDRYYDTLQCLGYINDNTVHKLLVLTFLNKLLKLNCSFITEDQYSKINEAIYKLQECTCIIPDNTSNIPSYYSTVCKDNSKVYNSNSYK